MLKKFREFDGWTKAIAVLLFGSMFLGKAFPYIAVTFGGLLLFSPRLLWDRWYLALTRRQDPLNGFAWPLLISLLYGFAQLIHGLLLGYPLFVALEILLFNISPVYIFLGIWAGYCHPGIVRAYIRYIAWFLVVYTPLYFLFLNKLNLSWGGADSDSPVLGSPGSGSVTLLGLLAYEPDLVKFWAPILVLACLTIANQERADWLGLGLALMIWGKLAKKMSRVLAVLGTIVVVLLIAALLDLRLPALPGRGGELSARETVARMAGSVSPELAESVGGGRGNALFYYGTVYWRKQWWAQIRSEVSKDTTTMIFGLGYGYPLAKLTGNAGTVKEGTRSPHNIFYFALAYSGLVGVGIFFWLEFGVIRILYRVFKVTGQIYGLAYFVYSFSGAFFGNFLETPTAILFYLMLGLCIGPMFLQMDIDRRAALAEPMQVAELV
jgi:O-Antigen ligase